MQGIIEDLVNELTRLPGIGRKTAQRLAFFILSMPEGDALSLASAIERVRRNARFCRQCFNISENDLCGICSDASRNTGRICVVEEPSNIIVLERVKLNCLYHVLLGALSPLDGITPDKLKMRELVERVKGGNVQEVIIATNPNTKGELTAQYIKEVLSSMPVKVTRIAYGLPMGSDIEFADEVTLGKALEGRREL
ncbi:MAG: recombination protein RecR [Nitrospirae bacterium]|nr:recombination protein RecR [Nitrospirota bacterium]